ncbi:unnamed protein product [Arctia plantaginis]|uniref:Uncharacterized protein n=2 Tax=Arctia plantaginis TaxID=874455 RepID=A0A8S1ANH0_ARCPL|nr:unnamed protein product [Arctia plantaginis]
MPVDRTPPKQQITLPTRTVQRQRSDSEPNLNLNDMQCELENLNVTVRAKRKRSEDSGDVNLSVFMSEMTKMFHDFKNEQELKVAAILASVTDIKKQNSDICASVEYVSKSYDALLEQINHLKSERQENLNYIRTLENRLEKAERNARSSCVEIRNIPPNKKESKEQLLHTIIATGRTLNIPIESYEVRDIFRIQTKEPDQKPIIVDFTSVIKKERIHRLKMSAEKNTSELPANKPSAEVTDNGEVANPQEATPQEATPQENTPQENTLQETTPKEATPKEATSQEATPRKATSQEATKQKAASQEPSSKKATSQEATPEKATSQEATPKKATSQEATSKKPTSQEATSKKSTSQEATSKKPTSQEAKSKKPTSQQATSKKPTSQQATSKKPTSQEATSKTATSQEVTSEENERAALQEAVRLLYDEPYTAPSSPEQPQQEQSMVRLIFIS